MIHTIVAALVVAVAAISGIFYFAALFQRGQRANDQLSAWAKRSCEDREALRVEIYRMKAQMPHYGRDPATGRFVKKAA